MELLVSVKAVKAGDIIGDKTIDIAVDIDDGALEDIAAENTGEGDKDDEEVIADEYTDGVDLSSVVQRVS
jgi:hypothetical protein